MAGSERVKVRSCLYAPCKKIALGKSFLCDWHTRCIRNSLGDEFRNGRPKNHRQSTRSTMLYALSLNEFIKVGVTDDIKARVWAIQVASPYPIELIGEICVMQCVEPAIHAGLSAFQVRGEWYRRQGRVIDFCEAIVKGDSLAIAEIALINKDWVGMEKGWVEPTERIPLARGQLKRALGDKYFSVTADELQHVLEEITGIRGQTIQEVAAR